MNMMPIGTIIHVHRAPPVTLLEIAERAVEDARVEFERARIRLSAAEERWRIVARYEYWKDRGISNGESKRTNRTCDSAA